MTDHSLPPSPTRSPFPWGSIAAIALLLGALLWLFWPASREVAEAPDAASGGNAGAEYVTAHPEIPRIDVHVHLAPAHYLEALEHMDTGHVRIALNASGGAADGALSLSMRVAEETGGRILPYCNVRFVRLDEPGLEEALRQSVSRCKAQGGVGIKIAKSLGLGIPAPEGGLLAVDDPRLDPLFDEAGRQGLPVLIHAGDPQAFFRPPSADNERYAELLAHPGWSFHGLRSNGEPWPSWETVFAQYERRVARHPATTFVGAHFGNAPEEPERVGRMLAAYPNLMIETGARVPEIGRHPASSMRRLFETYQDRILFGTDLAVTSEGLTLGSRGQEHDPRGRVAPFFAAHWRYFETDDEDFAHPTPIQGDWTIDGLALPPAVLEKVYFRNALRVFGVELPRD